MVLQWFSGRWEKNKRSYKKNVERLTKHDWAICTGWEPVPGLSQFDIFTKRQISDIAISDIALFQIFTAVFFPEEFDLNQIKFSQPCFSQRNLI